jgi:hypothetical protein
MLKIKRLIVPELKTVRELAEPTSTEDGWPYFRNKDRRSTDSGKNGSLSQYV